MLASDLRLDTTTHPANILRRFKKGFFSGKDRSVLGTDQCQERQGLIPFARSISVVRIPTLGEQQVVDVCDVCDEPLS